MWKRFKNCSQFNFRSNSNFAKPLSFATKALVERAFYDRRGE